MSRTLYGDNHPHVANDLINLGAVQFEWGHYRQAERCYRQAIAINEAWCTIAIDGVENAARVLVWAHGRAGAATRAALTTASFTILLHARRWATK